jgi:hypothetical protein
MRYLTDDDVSELGIERDDLRRLSVENLRRLLPDVQMAGDNGVFLMQAGGDYEASLLLIDSFGAANKSKWTAKSSSPFPRAAFWSSRAAATNPV